MTYLHTSFNFNIILLSLNIHISGTSIKLFNLLNFGPPLMVLLNLASGVPMFKKKSRNFPPEEGGEI